jgi:hypothetical protein
MSNVFVNGREISGKASTNKSIGAMPCVALSPPAPPVGPVPIPYPNTAVASDTTNGSKTVTRGGKEVGLKNVSTYKTSTGNEPATNTFGADVITHKLKGAMRHASWSFDVKIEGQNAIRHMDLTTHNHANAGSGVTSNVGGMKTGGPSTAGDCKELSAKNKESRTGMWESGRKRFKSVAEGKTTITHAVYQPVEGAAAGMKACSRIIAQKYDNGFVTGMSRETRLANSGAEGTKSTVCGEPYNYPRSGRFLTSHTESRILETIFGQHGPTPGGRLLMSIDWNATPPSREPCPNCRDLICSASKCMTILLCDDHNRPQEPDCKKRK